MLSPLARRAIVALTLTLTGAAGALVACSSFGGSDGPSADAAVADDAATPDDGASSADASCARYCACQSDAAFCADFDTAALLGEWDKMNASDGSVLEAVASDRSPPNALQLSTPASAEGTGASVVKKTIVGDVATMSLSFDIAPSMLSISADAGASTEFVSLTTYAEGAPGAIVALVTSAAGQQLFIPGGATELTNLLSFPNTRPWVRVHIQVKAGFISVHYDDGPTVGPPAPFPATGDLVQFRLGLSNSGASGASRLAYDNVVVRFE
jgi:hypothetical protein